MYSSCQIVPPRVILGPVLEFLHCAFILPWVFHFCHPIGYHLPWFFIFATLAYYSALGFSLTVVGYKFNRQIFDAASFRSNFYVFNCNYLQQKLYHWKAQYILHLPGISKIIKIKLLLLQILQ